MKNLLPPLLLISLLIGCSTGCQSSRPVPARDPANTSLDIRNNCYSLLAQLMDQEKDVSKLRFIKREQADLKKIINTIAARSGDAAGHLQAFARLDPSLDLKDFRLPPGEEATRKAIASTKTRELLKQSGPDFEMSLFLAQTEALNYAAHLAKVAAANDTQPDRARYLADLSAQMIELEHQLITLMRSRMKTLY